jgi:hypothetical protein
LGFLKRNRLKYRKISKDVEENFSEDAEKDFTIYNNVMDQCVTQAAVCRHCTLPPQAAPVSDEWFVCMN